MKATNYATHQVNFDGCISILGKLKEIIKMTWFLFLEYKESIKLSTYHAKVGSNTAYM